MTESLDPAESGFAHDPVMIDEILEAFAGLPAGWLVDMTLGGGGHAGRILAERPDLRLLGLDRDLTALAHARRSLAGFGDRVVTVHARFDALTDLMSSLAIDSVSAVLFDLGVSSPQLDRAERGFSYRHDGPLDMRMDATQTLSAADVVNGTPQDELARILADYGDERFAARIAAAIVAARPIRTTRELAEIVRTAIPAATRRRGGHPAKRTFQAIRIEVNQELVVLADALEQAIRVTRPGGRIAVLSYHSGEDRIVKSAFRRAAGGDCTCPPGLPCVCRARRAVRIVRPEKRRPRPDEVARNPRAESAILRVVERIDEADASVARGPE